MKILFVCTGNIFRSMSAEYLMKKYCKDNKIAHIKISSAGTTAHPQPPFPQTVERLNYYGCDTSKHKQRKVSKRILERQDIIICMAKHHQETVKELGFSSILFNKITYNKNKDLLDDTEYIEKFGALDIPKYVTEIVDYIHDGIPLLTQKIQKKILQ